MTTVQGTITINSINAGTITTGAYIPKNWYANGGVISNNITVEKTEFEELKDDSLLLYALIDAGVEDWPGWKEAIAIYRDRRDEDVS